MTARVPLRTLNPMSDPLLSTTEMRIGTVSTLEELARVVQDSGRAYVRYSEGPENDQDTSVDTESGLALPGLSVNPLHAETWWSRPFEDWLARQVCQYRDLQEKNPERYPWVLLGREVGRGPDCEPLLRDVVPLARLDDRLLSEAAHRYETRFDAGKGPED
jgi:hypothetical protein